jgi:hypothetical protein
VSFLEGFGVGAFVHGKTTPHSSFTPFLIWLVDKFQIDKIIINWVDFRERFSSDPEAFENLRILYEEYAEINQS